MTIAEAVWLVDFDAWARAQGWEAICDPSLAFTSPILAKLLAAWRAQAGKDAIPSRRAMSARSLKPFLGYVSIMERVADSPADYRVRLMGTRIANLLGDMQGKLIWDVLPENLCPRWQYGLDLTLAQGRPLRLVSRVAFRQLDFLQAELLLAPLLDGGDRPSLVLAGAVFTAAAVRAGACVAV